ncbi:EAL domain-containing protein [Cellulomonas sp. APG4]|uniref:EAL domain-containing protein n=1 Tax=Cellulomonas sp. APG4 TaxID=1538656 RepID=UPI00137AEB0B|nr:EAL domain-containing protein [Cellulomonas sp. APG4]
MTHATVGAASSRAHGGPTAPRIGVLSPSTGGFFFGEVLAGIVRAAAEQGATVTMLQTLDAGRTGDEFAPPPENLPPVAWDRLDGVITVAWATDADTIRRLLDRGTPVVLVSNDLDVDAATVVIDNRTGVLEGLRHLVEHGHERIAFVGNLAQTDMHERYEAYLEGLHLAGLDPAGELVPTEDHAETGGVAAAAAVAAAHRAGVTALVVATDRVALGLVRGLAEQDVRVPQDLALVAFDDVEPGWTSDPPLTTVNQRFADQGVAAVDLLLAELDGRPVEHRRHVMPAAFVRRGSCGCDPTAGPGDGVGSRDARALVRAVLRAAGTHPDDDVVAVAGALAATEAAHLDHVVDDAVAELGYDLVSPEVHAQLASGVTTAIAGLGRTLHAAGLPGADLLDRVLARTTSAVARLQAVHNLDRVTRLAEALGDQYELGMGMLGTVEDDPRSLAWLHAVGVRAGCLGVWDGPPGSPRLRLVGLYDPTGAVGPLPETVPVAEFPPAPLLDLADPLADEVAYVVPVRGASGDHGFLCVVGAVDTEFGTGRATYNHWASLLGVALRERALLEEVRRSATYDAVTGLPNRRLFRERLGHALDLAARRPDAGFAVVFCDLDGFKLVNDSLGHLRGDELLAEVGHRLRAELRAVDTAARFGGDEFAVLLCDPVPDEVLTIAARLQRRIAEPIDLDGTEVRVTASIGITTSDAGYTSAEDVLRDADTAMYHAKATERGTASVFDPAMHVRATDRLRARSEVRTALDAQQFVVHYQPVVALDGGRVRHLEALVRWDHPTRGLLPPGAFLDDMADDGSVVELGQWLVDTVCAQLARWRRITPDVTVAVNLSHREFWAPDLPAFLTATLDRHGVPASSLVLEITESVIMADTQAARERMDALHALGLALHIDDFGTGHSSLGALRTFPVDALKIDGSFVRDLATDRQTSELVRIILAMGATLEMEVVAECVETPDQARHLAELGCRDVQGWLYSRALPAHEAGLLVGRPLVPAAPEGPPATLGPPGPPRRGT